MKKLLSQSHYWSAPSTLNKDAVEEVEIELKVEFKVIWEEVGERIIGDKNIKLIEAGKDFFKYEGIFPESEFLEFLNFQLNRKITSKVKILFVQPFINRL